MQEIPPALSPHPVNLAGCRWRCLCMRAASQSRSDEYDVSTFTYLRGPFAKELITAEYYEKILTILGYSGCLNLGTPRTMIALRASDHMLDILHMVLTDGL